MHVHVVGYSCMVDDAWYVLVYSRMYVFVGYFLLLVDGIVVCTCL